MVVHERFLQELDGNNIRKAFMSGASSVINSRLLLNKINFFPVADSDTGNNLAITLSGLKDVHTTSNQPHEVLAAIADACLLTARGNSGLIFSQFFHGLAEYCPVSKNLNIKEFCTLITKATLEACEAITNPVAGTIITLMTAWSNCCNQFSNVASDFHDLFDRTMPILNQALCSTAKIQVLANNQSVVDAGAKGFYLFIEGVKNFLNDNENFSAKNLQDTPSLIDEFKKQSSHVNDTLPQFRYCTESIIISNCSNAKILQKKLMGYGDSVVVSGRKGRYRIHLHTNNPCQVFTDLDSSAYEHPKVEDMWSQYKVARGGKQPIGLVTDSVADLPQELIDKYQIHVIPINIFFGNSAYLDKMTISAEQFYKKLNVATEYPTTAMPSFNFITNLFDSIASYYENILVVTVSSKLTGLFNLVSRAATKYNNIHVIDSKKNSGAQGLLIKRCAELIAAKCYSFEEIIDWLKSEINKTHIFVSIDDLKSTIKSGRVTKLQGTFANLINFKPVLGLDSEGRGVMVAKTFSRHKAIAKIVHFVRELHQQNFVNSYCILNANAANRASELLVQMQDLLGIRPEYSMQVSPAVGLHAGIGAIAVAVHCKY